MKATFRIIVAAVLMAAATFYADARKVKGTVSGEGQRLPGVIVTDGYSFTRTNAQGRYTLDVADASRFVFVVTPAGYTGDFSGGAPQFYRKLTDAATYDFDLVATAGGEDFTLLSVSDPQMQNEKHLKRFRGKPLEELTKVAAERSAVNYTVGMSLGDIGWNKLELHQDYLESIRTVGIPFYTVIGNHDFIQNLDLPEAASTYESSFGPYDYAFFLGKDLVIGLNNIRFKASGIEDPGKSSNNYDEGYSDEELGFVRGLLRLIPEDTHIFIAQHSPIFFWMHDKFIARADEMLEILAGRKVDFLCGHTHIMNKHTYAPGIREHNAAAFCGAWWATTWCNDGTPRGFEIFDSHAGELSWTWHNIDYPEDFQVEFIGLGESRYNPKCVIANVWEYDENWKVEWYEDGTYKGLTKLVEDVSPIYIRQIEDVYKGDVKKIPGYKRPRKNIHYFAAKPSGKARFVTMTVTAPDGRTWSHRFDLNESRKKDIAPAKGKKSVEASELTMLGKVLETQNPYHRVDTVRYKGFTKRESELVRMSAGLAVAFRTNSKSISVRSAYNKVYRGRNLTEITCKGYDLYARVGKGWRWVGTQCFSGDDEWTPAQLVSNMDSSMHEFLLYLPLYSELSSVRIEVDEDAIVEAAGNPFGKRLAVFGSSYSHGISASRPGMSYPSQLERRLGVEVLNLGVSGNSKLQPQFAAVMEDVEADAYLFDTFSNPSPKEIRERLQPFVERMVKAHPGKPLIFQNTIYREKRFLDLKTEAFEAEKQAVADSLMRLLVKRYPDVHYIVPDAGTPDHETSADGIHPSDYGYMLWERSIEKKVKKLLK